MKKFCSIRQQLLIVAVIICILPVSASAASKQEIADYLNSIDTARANFVQAEGNSTPLKGMFYFARPGKLRLAYNPPPAITLIANGTRVQYYDAQLDQLTYLEQEAFPPNALFGRTVDFENFPFTATLEETPVASHLTITDPNGNWQPITFSFNNEPLQLRYWTYPNEHGQPVLVTLENLQTGIELPDETFRLRNPRIDRPR